MKHSEHHKKEMKSFILVSLALINISEAIFRSRLNKFTAKTYQDDKLSLNMAHKGHSTAHMGHSIRGSHGKRNQIGGKCQMPCQREPFWIPFAAVMELGYIPNILRDKNFLDEFSRIRQQVVRFPAITNKKIKQCVNY